LNLKDLLLKITAEDAVVLRLEKKGPGEATAADIQLPGDVEILNPSLHIATVNANGTLAIDITVDRGRGYISADRNKRSNVIGVIPVDSIFSPVRRVTYTIEPVRVEQSTDFDRLVLDIETDGTITPREALASAGATLGSLVGLVSSLDEESAGLELGDVGAALGASSELDARIEDLGLTERARNCLKRGGVNSIGELVACTEKDLLSITNFGQTSLKDVNDRLDERGLALRTED
jgi:DNA-directed RNA polymerase subunit alpha